MWSNDVAGGRIQMQHAIYLVGCVCVCCVLCLLKVGNDENKMRQQTFVYRQTCIGAFNVSFPLFMFTVPMYIEKKIVIFSIRPGGKIVFGISWY